MTTTHYRTKDLAEASLLVTKGVKLDNIERDGDVCWFIFADKKQAEVLSHKYWYEECLVNAQSYYQAMRSLKARIFSM